MASECSRIRKSRDCSLYTLQRLILEAIGPLSQLLEAINDPNPQVSLDQIEEAVETAIIILANSYNKTSLIRRTKILEEYNKELMIVAGAQERNWVTTVWAKFSESPCTLSPASPADMKSGTATTEFSAVPPLGVSRGMGEGKDRQELITEDNLHTPGQPIKRLIFQGIEEEMTRVFVYGQCNTIAIVNHMLDKAVRGSFLPSGEGGSVSSRQSPPSSRLYSVLFLVPNKKANKASDQPQSPQL